MDRFHLVVSNYSRITSFVDNFDKIKSFDPSCDKIYIMDCSPEETWQNELEYAKKLERFGLKYNHNLFFIRRRNWNLNHGAQLDYIKSVIDANIPEPKYIAFVQEHYFDLKNSVKDDTIPENSDYDMDRIEDAFTKDRDVGCVFFARNGIRVGQTNPAKSHDDFFWGDSDTVLQSYSRSKYRYLIDNHKAIKGSRARCFLVDGGNFIVKTKLYTDWFKSRPHLLMNGDGSYGFCHVWEIRLGYILYTQNIKWVDMANNLSYTKAEELFELQKQSEKSLYKLWYENRIWFFYYGRDMSKYMPLPFMDVRKYLREYLRYK